MSILYAAPTDTVFGLTMNVNDGGGVTGLTINVRIRDGSTTDSYLDFFDMTFRTSGWTTQEVTLDEIGNGDYEYDLLLSTIVGISSIDGIVAEYQSASGTVFDQSQVILIGPIAEVPLTLTVNEVGGVTGLTATVALRDTSSNDSYLDFDDLTFKTSAWTTQFLALTDIGRGHYAGSIDMTTLIGATSVPVMAEYSTTGSVTSVAAERIAPGTSVGSDIVPPVVVFVDPLPGGSLEPDDAITVDITDLSGLAGSFLTAAFLSGSTRVFREVVYDIDGFDPDYAGSTRTPIVNGFRYVLRRASDWPAGMQIDLKAIPFDLAGN